MIRHNSVLIKMMNIKLQIFNSWISSLTKKFSGELKFISFCCKKNNSLADAQDIIFFVSKFYEGERVRRREKEEVVFAINVTYASKCRIYLEI